MGIANEVADKQVLLAALGTADPLPLAAHSPRIPSNARSDDVHHRAILRSGERVGVREKLADVAVGILPAREDEGGLSTSRC